MRIEKTSRKVRVKQILSPLDDLILRKRNKKFEVVSRGGRDTIRYSIIDVNGVELIPKGFRPYEVKVNYDTVVEWYHTLAERVVRCTRKETQYRLYYMRCLLKIEKSEGQEFLTPEVVEYMTKILLRAITLHPTGTRHHIELTKDKDGFITTTVTVDTHTYRLSNRGYGRARDIGMLNRGRLMRKVLGETGHRMYEINSGNAKFFTESITDSKAFITNQDVIKTKLTYSLRMR